METAIIKVPFCGCFKPVEQAEILNNGWCDKVNQELLIPAGYQCKAKGNDDYGDRLQIRILKSVPGDFISVAPIAATIARDVPTEEPLVLAAVVQPPA
jgi:hypothetical protein